jgi:hypothetical protein
MRQEGFSSQSRALGTAILVKDVDEAKKNERQAHQYQQGVAARLNRKLIAAIR